MKKLPVEVDIPELLGDLGKIIDATDFVMAMGDCVLIAFYFLSRVGEYTVKCNRNESKQTKQFKLEDCTFFILNVLGQLRQLDGWVSATLKLDNSKNGWKGVCVHQETNGEEHNCPGIKAIA